MVAIVAIVFAAGGGVAACVATRPAGGPPIQAGPDAGMILVDDFEAGAESSAPALAWQHEVFKGIPATSYTVCREAGNGYLHGEAVAGGSLLTRAVDVDPNEGRYLRLRCRVTGLPAGADIRRRDTDDCGLRVFVTFAYEPQRASFGEKVARSLAGRDLPGSSLCYVWTDGVDAGSVLPSPFTDRTQMVVQQNSQGALGEWTTVERDLVADYRRAFGRTPPQVTGVAIMVDADQTNGRAGADIDDIELRRAQ